MFTVVRRVHITEETYEHLGGAYQVEEGNGADRDSALHGRRTFLVIDPHTQDRTDSKHKVAMSFKCLKVFGAGSVLYRGGTAIYRGSSGYDPPFYTPPIIIFTKVMGYGTLEGQT